MKYLFTTLLITLLILFPTLGFSQVGVIREGTNIPDIQEACLEDNISVDRAIASSVSIVIKSNQGWGSCSGVVIKNTIKEAIVLTAKHCITPSEELYVEGILVTDIGVALTEDLAYIKLNELILDKMPVIISEFVAKKGDEIINVGYPKLNEFISFGIVHINIKDWQTAKIEIKSGCSGGGMFNKYGELVGIVWGSIDSWNLGLFEGLNDVKKFINKKNLLK